MVAILLGALYFFGIHPFVVGGSRMEKFCLDLSPGLSLAELAARAEEDGYDFYPTHTANPNYLIVDRRAMGRFICDVTTANGSLISAKYMFND